MPRIQLRMYIEPGQAEVICNILRKDQHYDRFTAVIDTGAEVSLLPIELLDQIVSRSGERGRFTVEQAGIARQTFEAVEAYVTLFFEDAIGRSTRPFEVRAWFSQTNVPLIGFADVLDRAILHIDMLDQRRGWLEIDA